MSPPLLLVGAALLILCGGALLLARRMDDADRQARALAALAAYRTVRLPPADAARAGPRARRLDLGTRLPSLFGIDRKRSGDYPVRWWLVLAASFAVAAAAGWLIGLMASLPQWLPVPLLWVMFSRAVFALFERRRRNLLFEQFADVLGGIVRALQVGHTVAEALRGVARDAPQPTAGTFTRLADRLAIGVPLADALPEIAAESGITEYRFFCVAVILQNQTGGSLTETLDSLAEVIRGRVMLRRRALAMTSEVRTSALVLGVLPVVTFVGMLVTAPAYAGVLLHDPTGTRILGAAVAMLLTGAVIMHALISRQVR